MREQPPDKKIPSQPGVSSPNVTSAIGMEETAGHLRARRSSLFTRTVIWITGLICLAFLLGTLTQAMSNNQLNQRVQSAQQQLQQLQDQHTRLTQAARHYQNPAVIETEAREQLGYIRPGEHPVVIVSSTPADQQNQQQPQSSSSSQGFWQDWWNIFFGN